MTRIYLDMKTKLINKVICIIVLLFLTSCKLMLRPSIEFYSSKLGDNTLTIYHADSTFFYQNEIYDEYGRFKINGDTIIILPIVELYKGDSFDKFSNVIPDCKEVLPSYRYYLRGNNKLKEITSEVYKNNPNVFCDFIFINDLYRINNLKHWRNNINIYGNIPIATASKRQWRKFYRNRIKKEIESYKK